MILASNIIVKDNRKSLNRNNIDFSDQPEHSFLRDKPFYIYHEVYNLRLYENSYRTWYTIKYALEPVQDIIVENSSLWSKIMKIFRRDEKTEQRWIEFEFRGNKKDDNHILKIDPNVEKPGNYKLTLMIIDKVNGQTVKRSLDIRLF
jgi:hypothetical protein